MNAMVDIGWTDERVTLLKKLWRQDGLSCSQIAAVLGGGATRNSVIGKLHRLKLTESAKPVVTKPTVVKRHGNAGQPNVAGIKRRFARKATEATIEARLVDADRDATRLLKSEIWQPLAGTTPLSLEALGQHDCKWPLGDPLEPGFGYCGMPREHDQTSYCATHRRVSVERVR